MNKGEPPGSRSALVVPVGTYTDSQAKALLAAGRLLQSRHGSNMKIAVSEGESYPRAVSRVIAGLDDGSRAKLREQVEFVLAYEKYESADRRNERSDT